MNDTQQTYIFILIYISIIVFFLLLIFPTANVFFELKIKKKYKKIQYENEYFREMLTYSPSEILYIYDQVFENSYLNPHRIKKLFLVNLLKMNLLDYISIDFSNSDNFKVTKKDVIILEEEYKQINDYLFNRITFKNEITLHEIFDYVNENPNSEIFKTWDKYIKTKIKKRGFYNGDFITFYEKEMKLYYKINIPILSIICVILLIVNFRMGLIMLITFPFLLLMGYYETKGIKVTSDLGVYEYKKVIALKNFLKDFSIIDERDNSYSKILEDYVVYANIFDL